MKKMRIFRTIFIFAASLTAFFAFVSAGSSGMLYDDRLYFELLATDVGNYDKSEYFADLMIPIDESDERYTEHNAKVFDLLTADCELAQYNEDGYRSTLMHMDGTRETRGIIQTLYLPEDMGYTDEAFTAFCEKYPRARLALCDKWGNILRVSGTFELKKSGGLVVNKMIRYDFGSCAVDCSYLPGAGANSNMRYLASVTRYCAVAAVVLFIFGISYKKAQGNEYTYAVLSGTLNIPYILILFGDLFAMVFGTGELVMGVVWWLRSSLISFLLTGEFFILAVFIMFFRKYRNKGKYGYKP